MAFDREAALRELNQYYKSDIGGGVSPSESPEFDREAALKELNKYYQSKSGGESIFSKAKPSIDEGVDYVKNIPTKPLFDKGDYTTASIGSRQLEIEEPKKASIADVGGAFAKRLPKVVLSDFGGMLTNLADIGATVGTGGINKIIPEKYNPQAAVINQVRDYLAKIGDTESQKIKEESGFDPNKGIIKGAYTVGKRLYKSATQDEIPIEQYKFGQEQEEPKSAIREGLEGLGEGAIDFADRLTSPRELAFFIPALKKAVAAGLYAPGMIKGAAEGGIEAVKSLLAGDPKQAGYSAAQGIGAGIVGRGIVKSGLKKSIYKQPVDGIIQDGGKDAPSISIEEIQGGDGAPPPAIREVSVLPTAREKQLRLEAPKPKPEVITDPSRMLPSKEMWVEGPETTREVARSIKPEAQKILVDASPKEDGAFYNFAEKKFQKEVDYTPPVTLGTEKITEPTGFIVKEEVTPETQKTLSYQIDSLKDGRNRVVLVTKGAEMPSVPKIFKTVDTDVGTFIYNPLKTNKNTILKKVSDGTHGELLGHLEPKSEKTTQVVKAEMPDGTEAKSSVVSPEKAETQAQILKQQFPEAEVKIGGDELAGEILNDRTQYTSLIKSPLKRNYRAGLNNVQIEFSNELQRDLYDLRANIKYQTGGGQNKASQRSSKNTEAVAESISKQTGMPVDEIYSLSRQVFDDVKLQLKGAKNGQLIALKNNVIKQLLSQKEPTQVKNAEPSVAKNIQQATSEPETKVSGLAKQIESRLGEDIENKATYISRATEQQKQRIEELSKNKDIIKQIMRGEAPVPEGIDPASLYTVLENKAIESGDFELQRELAASPLGGALSQAASSLSMRGHLKGDYSTNPIEAMREVAVIREKVAEKRYGKKYKEKIEKGVQLASEKVRQDAATKVKKFKTVAEFIDSLRC